MSYIWKGSPKKKKKKLGSRLGESTLTSCERKHYKDCKLALLACCFLNENSLDTFLSRLKPCLSDSNACPQN